MLESALLSPLLAQQRTKDDYYYILHRREERAKNRPLGCRTALQLRQRDIVKLAHKSLRPSTHFERNLGLTRQGTRYFSMEECQKRGLRMLWLFDFNSLKVDSDLEKEFLRETDSEEEEARRQRERGGVGRKHPAAAARNNPRRAYYAALAKCFAIAKKWVPQTVNDGSALHFYFYLDIDRMQLSLIYHHHQCQQYLMLEVHGPALQKNAAKAKDFLKCLQAGILLTLRVHC
eukprot:1159762-Pelagomonas_calceolata.AAC.4